VGSNLFRGEMIKVEEKDTVLMSSLGNPKPNKEASFTFLCSG
jgi:hypothetical protein